MKIYILADMEGISGIRMRPEVDKAHAEYEHGRQLMMAEMNVVIDAAFGAGAEAVVACDTHAGGGQVRTNAIDGRAITETPNAGQMMPSLDGSFAGVILLGHHGMAGTLNGFLDHTMSSRSWFEYRINDRVVGEIGIEAAYAGHYDVPVIMVAGDEAAAAEAVATLGDVEAVAVKRGIGRERACCVPLPEAHERIRRGVADAIQRIDQFKPYKPTLPATVQLTLYRSDMADEMMRPGVERVDARTVRQRIDCLLDVCRW